MHKGWFGNIKANKVLVYLPSNYRLGTQVLDFSSFDNKVYVYLDYELFTKSMSKVQNNI